MNQQQQAQAAQLLAASAYDATQPPPEDQSVFRILMRIVGSLGDYILLTGKKSAGKTKFGSAIIAAALTANEIFNFHIKLPAHKRNVLHIDTEQGRGSHYKMMKLIIELSQAEGHPVNLKSHRCRGFAPNHIQWMVEYYLMQNPSCGLVILDGMLDTIESMNDEREATRVKRWMERLSEEYNTLIVGVIHRGFSADKAIGQIGSFLERGAQTVLHIKREKENNLTYYSIQAEYIRDDAPFDPYAIYFDDRQRVWQLFDQMPNEATTDIHGRGHRIKMPAEYDIQELDRVCSQIFDPLGEFIHYSDLDQGLQEALGIGRNNARTKFIPYLLQKNIVYKTENGYTNKQQAKLFIASKT